ncbi:MAG: alpha/beta hydrolase [Pseudomonadota bacterium]
MSDKSKSLFPGFECLCQAVAAGEIRLRCGGSGPPLVLLHGNPQTHLMWHAVAPSLAREFTVYCPDIRGYGISPKPSSRADSGAYAKRAMAGDIFELMDHFGHARFAIVGHDRGARVAHRMAIDCPERVTKLALLDIIPTIEHFERTDMAFARAYAHWFYLAMPRPFPEEMIEANPERWLERHCGRPMPPEDLFHPEALADYRACIADPDVITGICEDYRAAAGIDLEHDRVSRETGRRIDCPLLVLWGETGIIERLYDPLAIWQRYCTTEVQGTCIKGAGHYLAEQAPEDVLTHLFPFLSS